MGCASLYVIIIFHMIISMVERGIRRQTDFEALGQARLDWAAQAIRGAIRVRISLKTSCELIGLQQAPREHWHRFLSLAFRGLKAVPKLRHRHYISRKINMFRDYCRSRLPLPFHRDPLTGLLTLGRHHDCAPSTASSIHFPSFDSVTASIIIPVQNGCQKTRECLRSIIDSTPCPNYEVIVIDDSSSDETRDFLSGVRGIVLLRWPKNPGLHGLVQPRSRIGVRKLSPLSFPKRDCHARVVGVARSDL